MDSSTAKPTHGASWIASFSWASTSCVNASLFFVADDADRYLLYFVAQLFVLFPLITALMHSLTTPPSENVFFVLT